MMYAVSPKVLILERELRQIDAEIAAARNAESEAHDALLESLRRRQTIEGILQKLLNRATKVRSAKEGAA